MSRSTFRVNKICEYCKGLFEAQKITTRFCSQSCNSRNYKLRKKLEKRGIAEQVIKQQPFKVKVNAVNIELLKNKPFLTVNEVAALLMLSQKTVYRLIEQGAIGAARFSARTLRIKYSEIEKHFINPAKSVLRTNEVYSIAEIKAKYGISDNGLRAIVKRENITKEQRDGFVYYPKYEIDKIFVG